MSSTFGLSPRWLLILVGGFGLLFVLLAIVIVVLLLRRGTRRKEPRPMDLHIDLSQLPAAPLPADGPRLEFYGTAVRLAVLILAPAGRHEHPTGQPSLLKLLDDIIPGLAAVAAAHRPLMRWWPSQLSTTGFASVFSQNVRLPGDRGKGTPWCSVAGRFESGEQPYLVGLVCVAEKPNSLSHVLVEHSGGWLNVLVAKGAA